MTRVAAKIIVISFFLLNCTACADSIRQRVNQGVDDAKAAMRAEEEKSENMFNTAKEVAIRQTADPLVKAKIATLTDYIHANVHLLDSTIGELEHLDINSQADFEYVKIMFLYKGVGDRIYKQIFDVHVSAREIAGWSGREGEVDRLKNGVINTLSVESWKEGDFASTGPLGASLILHSLKVELFQVGAICLTG